MASHDPHSPSSIKVEFCNDKCLSALPKQQTKDGVRQQEIEYFWAIDTIKVNIS